jgi:hypothetical protein
MSIPGDRGSGGRIPQPAEPDRAHDRILRTAGMALQFLPAIPGNPGNDRGETAAQPRSPLLLTLTLTLALTLALAPDLRTTGVRRSPERRIQIPRRPSSFSSLPSVLPTEGNEENEKAGNWVCVSSRSSWALLLRSGARRLVHPMSSETNWRSGGVPFSIVLGQGRGSESRSKSKSKKGLSRPQLESPLGFRAPVREQRRPAADPEETCRAPWVAPCIPKLLARSADVPSAAGTVHMFCVADEDIRAPPTSSGGTAPGRPVRSAIPHSTRFPSTPQCLPVSRP